MSAVKFEYAKKFRNMDFLSSVAVPTKVEQDERDALSAENFWVDHITYAKGNYLTKRSSHGTK